MSLLIYLLGYFGTYLFTLSLVDQYHRDLDTRMFTGLACLLWPFVLLIAAAYKLSELIWGKL